MRKGCPMSRQSHERSVEYCRSQELTGVATVTRVGVTTAQIDAVVTSVTLVAAAGARSEAVVAVASVVSIFSGEHFFDERRGSVPVGRCTEA